VAAIVGVVLADASIQWAAAAMLATAVLSNRLLVRATERLVTVDYSAKVSDSWRDAFWFWLNGMLFWIGTEISTLMTAQLAGERVAGIYAAATRLTGVFTILPRALANSVVPRLFGAHARGSGNGQLIGSVLLLTGVGGVILAETLLTAVPIIDLVYGAAYSESALVLEVSALFVLINFIRIPCTWYLATSDRVRMVTIALGAGATVNIAANSLLIPTYGALGAAWAAVISELILGAWAVLQSARFATPKILVAAGLGLLPGCVAYASHRLVAEILPWYLAAATGALLAACVGALAARSFRAGRNPFGLVVDEHTSDPKDRRRSGPTDPLV
jgi:O-antigen/teichoic acid export membrane protein